MKQLYEIHNIRYPPFEPARWIPSSLPIATQLHERGEFASREEAMKAMTSTNPSFKLGTNNAWFLERSFSYDGEELSVEQKGPVLESEPFIDAVQHQRTGWYLVPSPIHNIIRQFINGVVLVLLGALFYLFVSPLMLALGLPVYGLETVRWGLLDYPALAVFVVPLIFAPLLVRVFANLLELQRQNAFLASNPRRPLLQIEQKPVANQPLVLSVRFPKMDPQWNHVDVFWRVGILPPSREVLLQELGRKEHHQPPPGLSTELPHHWIVGLDDGTAGGEDAPMEMQEVQGGLFLRPMRIMASGEHQRWEEGNQVMLQPPLGTWPGSVNTDLLRVHWECILRIDRKKGGPLLWVEPLSVAHCTDAVSLEILPLHDGRSEMDISLATH
jgi:hypothetical protein